MGQNRNAVAEWLATQRTAQQDHDEHLAEIDEFLAAIDDAVDNQKVKLAGRRTEGERTVA